MAASSSSSAVVAAAAAWLVMLPATATNCGDCASQCTASCKDQASLTCGVARPSATPCSIACQDNSACRTSCDKAADGAYASCRWTPCTITCAITCT
ncbi:hypothetical protein HU200_019904 [Digitaria exilis]|uniref:Uncharacterized protein n=1 Tax=Digitaria exilis TaxID=1010633 RepID=A0A835F0Y0_9POAL|nr:hypothetical protein HU200_019904 [Digitaria exilis]